jgi:hypothetical protein
MKVSDTALFWALVGIFAGVNVLLMSIGSLPVGSEGLGVIVSAGCTIGLYSFLYKDNPLFKLMEHLYVGVAAAYTLLMGWYTVLWPDVFQELFVNRHFSVLVPTVLGFLLFTRFFPRISWMSRISFAFVIGLGAGLGIPRMVSSYIIEQIRPSIEPMILNGVFDVNLAIILVGVLCVLLYFFYSLEHKGIVGKASRVGIWFLMVSFGASFGYTIMARLSLLIGRVQFLLGDWIPIIQ